MAARLFQASPLSGSSCELRVKAWQGKEKGRGRGARWVEAWQRRDEITAVTGIPPYRGQASVSLSLSPLMVQHCARLACFLSAPNPCTPHLQGLGVVLLLDVAVAQAGRGQGWTEGTAFVSGAGRCEVQVGSTGTNTAAHCLHLTAAAVSSIIPNPPDLNQPSGCNGLSASAASQWPAALAYRSLRSALRARDRCDLGAGKQGHSWRQGEHQLGGLARDMWHTGTPRASRGLQLASQHPMLLTVRCGGRCAPRPARGQGQPELGMSATDIVACPSPFSSKRLALLPAPSAST